MLATARDLLREKGFGAFTMGELAAACGVGKATLYKHYPSKGELVVGVLVDGMREAERIHEGIPAEVRGLARIARMVEEGIVRRDELAVMHIQQVPHELMHHPRVQVELHAMHERFEAAVRQGQEDGQIVRNVPAPVLSGFLMSAFGPGLDFQAAALGTTAVALSRQLLPVVLRGMQEGGGEA